MCLNLDPRAALTRLESGVMNAPRLNVMGYGRGLVVTTVTQAGALLASATFVLLAARGLGPEGRGLQALLVSSGQLLALLLSFGLASSMPYLVSPDVRVAGLMAWRQAKLLFAAALMLCVGALLNRVRMFIPTLIGFEAVVIAFTLVTIAQTSYTSLALACGRLWAFNLSAVAGAVASLLLLFYLLRSNQATPESVVLAQILGMAVTVGYVLVDLWLHRLLRMTQIITVNLRTQLRASTLGYATALLTFLMFRVDVFLIAALAGGLSAVGIYSVAVAIAELLLRVPHWAGYLLMPIVARQRRDARHQTVKLFWLSTAFASCLFVGAVMLGFWLNGLVVSILGQEFLPVVPLLYWMFPRIIFQAGATILVSNLGGFGYTLFNPGSIAAGLAVVVGLDLLLLPHYGLLAASGASSAAAFATLLVITIGFLRLNGLPVTAFLPRLSRNTSTEERPSAV